MQRAGWQALSFQPLIRKKKAPRQPRRNDTERRAQALPPAPETKRAPPAGASGADEGETDGIRKLIRAAIVPRSSFWCRGTRWLFLVPLSSLLERSMTSLVRAAVAAMVGHKLARSIDVF
jgi:hypothetical protein